MKWFANLKTVTKLMLAFSFLVAVMSGVGYVGVRNMGAINETLNTLYARDLKGLSDVKEANINLIYIGRSVREGLLRRTPDASRQTVQDVERFFGALEENLGKAEKTLATAEGKAKMVELRKAYSTFQASVRAVLRHLEAGRYDEATAGLQQMKTEVTAVDDAMTFISKIKERLGQEAYEQSDAAYAQSVRLMISVIVVAALLGLGLGLVIARMIATPLRQAVGVLQAVGEGDYTQSLAVDTRDEVGQMAAALNQAVASVRTALEEVRTVADSVASASEQLASASQEIASGAQEQASSLEETASSLEEITATVKQNADNAQQANQLASGSRDAADRGGAVVGEAVEAMAEINRSSKKIADIITTIDEIAFQTNLLALNAAVEAARAGEQGRGFAVVAAEVRNLAQRSASAAKEIKALIQDSVRKVEAGSDLVNRSGETLQHIVTSVKRVTDIVAEIAAASREQTSGIEQVNKAVAQMDQVTQQNASQTEELSGTAESLTGQAEQLQGLVARFKLQAEGGQPRALRRHERRATAPAAKGAHGPAKATPRTASASKAAPRPQPGPNLNMAPAAVSAPANAESAFVEF